MSRNVVVSPLDHLDAALLLDDEHP